MPVHRPTPTLRGIQTDAERSTLSVPPAAPGQAPARGTSRPPAVATRSSSHAPVYPGLGPAPKGALPSLSEDTPGARFTPAPLPWDAPLTPQDLDFDDDEPVTTLHPRSRDSSPPPRSQPPGAAGSVSMPPPLPTDTRGFGSDLSGALARRSTTTFAVAGVIGGLSMLALGIWGVRAWSRSERSDEMEALAAAAELGGSEEELRGAVTAYEEALRLDPDASDLMARVACASAWLALEHDDETAAAQAERMLSRLGAATPPDAVEAQALLALGKGALGDAKRQLARLPPADARALHARGLVASVEGDFEGATQLLTQASSLSAADVRVVALLAEALQHVGRADAGEEQLRQVDPTGTRTRIRLARAKGHVLAGDFPAAMREAEAILAANPPAPRAERAWAELIRAQSLVETQPALALGAIKGSDGGLRAWDVDLLAARARLLLSLGSYRGAREEAERAVAVSPARADLLLVLAEATLKTGRPSPELLAKLPPSPAATLLQGEAALLRGDLDAARARFALLLDDAVHGARASLDLARVAAAEGRFEEAERMLSRVPGGTPGRAALQSEVRFAVAAPEAALPAFAEADRDPAAAVVAARIDAWTGRLAPAVAAYEHAAETWSGNAAPHLGLAELHLQRGDLRAAAAELEIARGAAPNAPEVELASAYNEIAGRKLPEAQARIEAAAMTGAMPSPLSRARGRLALARREPDAALVELRRASVASPRDPWIAVWIGQAYLQAGDPKNARDAFARALRIDGGLPEAHVGMALVSALSGSPVATAFSLRRAERSIASRQRGEDLRAQVSYVRGRLDLKFGRYGEAVARLKDATSRDPALAEAFAYLGYSVVDGRGARADACTAFARYLELAPEGPEAVEVRRMSRGCG